MVALHPEGVDRNHAPEGGDIRKKSSPSTRRAWIEIGCALLWHASHRLVALHPEGVDRNSAIMSRKTTGIVALHPEGVDRNTSLYSIIP